MKSSKELSGRAGAASGQVWPGEASLAALRGWYAGMSARAAVAQYLGHEKASGQSSRAMLGAVRTTLQCFARARGRLELADVFDDAAVSRAGRSSRSSGVGQPDRAGRVAQVDGEDGAGRQAGRTAQTARDPAREVARAI